MTIEELIIDDSFINYCLKKNEKDVLFWENYLLQNPGEQENIAEAAFFVIGISDIVKTIKEPVAPVSHENNQDFDFGAHEDQKVISLPFHFKIKWRWAAAILVFISLGIFTTYQLKSHKSASPGDLAFSETNKELEASPNAKNEILVNPNIYSTGIGEKKTICLPDSTKIVLNAMSRLRVDKDFGKLNRNVFIEGEALFDVTHNEKLPFIVDTKNFAVKVLGTKFNIRSYDNDRLDEAALLRGKIELTVKNKNAAESKIILKPLQKVFVDREGINATAVVSGSRLKKLSLNASTLELSKESETKLLETAWVYNLLDLEDEFFEDIAARLERKFGVTIIFKDDLVKRYRYTATFEKENVEEILAALSSSLPFSYKIEGKTITIKK